MANEGVQIVGGTPGQFRQVLATEIQKWKSVIKKAGIALE